MKIETLAVHAGFSNDPVTKSVAVPIYQTVSYAFDNAQHGADLFDLKVPGNIYTRITNPTNAILEERVAALEGGVGALAVSSGMTAITYAMLTLAHAGDNIISGAQLYGGTFTLFGHMFPQWGIETRFADASKPETFRKLIDGKTRAIYAETVGNPLANITDIEALANIAHEAGIPLIVDNTVPTPFFLRPFEWGADIVVHSLTKGMAGHGTSLGGAIVDSGKFPWKEHADKFQCLTTPDPSYHGVNYSEQFGKAAFIARARVVPLRNTGGALSPLSAFLIMQGIETMPLRMERVSYNAKKIAEYLHGNPKVAWVNSAWLPEHPDHALLQKYMGGNPPGLLSFGVKTPAGKDPRKVGAEVLDRFKLFTRLVNIGDTKSLATHPASTTHRQLNTQELKAAGVSEDMIRLSIGIEHIDDLIEDLEQAIN
jgi:O-acetylhomoserine (thiol)-lyase